MTKPAIRIRGLNFSYRSKQVLHDIDLDVPTGITALVGVNGAGKTTLLRNLLGDLTGTGTITFTPGGPAAPPTARQRLGYLPQSFGFPPNLTVAEFVAYFAWLHGVSRRDRAAAVWSALERVNLADEYGTKMGALSGGMLRRAGIAQALSYAPDVLLLDEPTAGLDPQQRLDLRELLAGLAEGTPVLVSTHLLEDVAEWGAHVVVLNRGRVCFTGSTAELLAAAGEPDSLERAFIAIMRPAAEEDPCA